MSILNATYKHCFIHVPKCAGTAMESCYWVGGNGHNPRTSYKVPKDFIVWAFVRNPYARLLSAYSGFTQIRPFMPLGKEAGSFEEFILALPTTYRRTMHTRPMVDFLNGHMDFVGRFERLDRDWREIQELVGVPPEPLPRRNQSRHQRWDYQYSTAMLSVVNELYAADFEAFNYKKMEIQTMAHTEQMNFVRGVKEMFPQFFGFGAAVLEVGSRIVCGSCRHEFDVAEYIGLDEIPGDGVDVVSHVADYVAGRQFDAVVCCEALEHDSRWQESLAAIMKLVRPGGLILITAAGPNRPPHNQDGDYYRNISIEDIEETLRDQLGDFADMEIQYDRGMHDIQMWAIVRDPVELTASPAPAVADPANQVAENAVETQPAERPAGAETPPNSEVPAPASDAGKPEETPQPKRKRGRPRKGTK